MGTKVSKSGDDATEVRRKEIVDAAASLFASKGIASTTMRDIAAHIGKTPGILYYHFKSKDDLLLAVHQRAEDWGEEIFASASKTDRDPWHNLEEASISHLRALLSRPDYAAIVGGRMPPKGTELRRNLVNIRDRWEKVFRDLIDKLPLKSDEDKKFLRMALLGALNHSAVWYRPNKDDPEVIAKQIVDLVRYKMSP